MPDKDIIPKDWAWAFEIAVGLFILLILSLGLKKLMSAIQKKKVPPEKIWRKNLHKIIHIPTQIAIWGFGAAYIIDVVGTHFEIDAITRYVRPFKGVFIVACLGWIVLRWIKEAFKHLAKKSEKLGVAPSTIYALNKLTSFVFGILFLLVIFQMLGLDMIPLLTFGGIGVAGIAFAAQDMIANFFGGAMLHFTRIFSIGDQVHIPGHSDFHGFVREIGWYTTRFEDFDRRPVYFPNALFSKANVINETRRSHRRIKETITVRYDDLPQIKEIIGKRQERVAAHDEVDHTQGFSIALQSYGDYGVDILLIALVYQTSFARFQEIKQEILLIVKEVIEESKAEFCYPTSNVFLTKTN